MAELKRWQPPQQPPRETNLDLVALALAPWTILLQGFSFGLGNNDFLLTFIRRINDSTYLSGDWMLSTPPSHPALLGLIAPLCDLWGESPAFLLVQIITRMILLCGVWRLSMALLPGRAWVAVAAMLCMVCEPRFHLGDHYMQAGHWEPAHLGMAFAVWIIAEGIRLISGRGHWITFTLVSGLGIFSHLFICLPLFAICFLAVCWKSGLPRKFLLIGFVSVLVLGSPVLIPAISGFFSPESSPLHGNEVINILQFRHPHHHQPWTWPALHYIEAILFLGACVYVWTQHRDKGLRQRLLLPGILFGYFIASCVLFAILGRIQALPIVAYVQCFRLLSMFLLMGMIGVYSRLDVLTKNRFLYLVTCAAAAVVMHTVQWGGPVVVALAAIAPSGRRSAEGEQAWKNPKWLMLATTAAGFAVIAAMQWNSGLRDRANRVDREHWLVAVEPPDDARKKFAEWVRANTSPDALFAVPPRMDYFRIWEERAVVIDLKNIPYRNAELKEWADRIKAAGVDNPYEKFSKPSPKDPNFEQMMELARKYRADYFAVREKVDDKRQLYDGAGYSVFRLGDFDKNILDGMQ